MTKWRIIISGMTNDALEVRSDDETILFRFTSNLHIHLLLLLIAQELLGASAPLYLYNNNDIYLSCTLISFLSHLFLILIVLVIIIIIIIELLFALLFLLNILAMENNNQIYRTLS